MAFAFSPQPHIYRAPAELLVDLLRPHAVRRQAPRLCADQSRADYLAQHPELESRLKSALDHAISTNAPDPRLVIAAQLLDVSPTNKLLPPNECPPAGVEFDYMLDRSLCKDSSCHWIFLWNHLLNLKFLHEMLLSSLPEWERPQAVYPARMSAAAGFRRSWSLQGSNEPDSAIGEQTITCLQRATSDEPANDVVGALVPVSRACFEVLQARFEALNQESIGFENFEWLAWMEPPEDLNSVIVWVPPVRLASQPTFELPILQSHVDTLMEGALLHGESFAAEWLDCTCGWSSFWLNDRMASRRPWVHQPHARQIDRILQAHPPPPLNTFSWRAHQTIYPTQHVAAAAYAKAEEWQQQRFAPVGDVRSPRMVAKNFVVGFGSIINTASRRQSDANAVDAAPCRIKRGWGYVREWNFQAPTAQICALGLRKTGPGEAGSTINGVIFPVSEGLASFDERENGYQRVEVPRHMIELLSWQTLPADCHVYVYVPYAPSVVQKYGADENGMPLCCGPDPPDGLDETTEGAGHGLLPPSVHYPILQTYIDVCLIGCLEHGEEFTREFIKTSFKWSPHWLNERELARRPWLHQRNYVQIDRLLAELVPDYFGQRKLESEYATLFLPENAEAGPGRATEQP